MNGNPLSEQVASLLASGDHEGRPYGIPIPGS